jgi:glycosyltransferase involved in cell wall biosynthesis
LLARRADVLVANDEETAGHAPAIVGARQLARRASALSFGVPVVGGARATYRELLADGDAGWLFEPGDPQSLASALDAAFSASDDGATWRPGRCADRGSSLGGIRAPARRALARQVYLGA